MKKLITFLLCCLPGFALADSASLMIQGTSAHFDTNKVLIINKAEVEKFANSIVDVAEMVVVYCHTDSRASAKYNRALAEQRCAEVGDLLRAKNLNVHAFVVQGEDSPLVSENGNETDKHGRMGLNRRVNILYSLKPISVPVPVVVTKEVVKRHRITLALGVAPSGVKQAQQIGVNTFQVREDFDFELGASYAIKPFVSGKFRWLNLGVSAYTNKSTFFHLGADL